MDSDQGQRNISTATRCRFLPRLHSVRNLLQSRHQVFHLLPRLVFRPKFLVNSANDLSQSTDERTHFAYADMRPEQIPIGVLAEWHVVANGPLHVRCFSFSINAKICNKRASIQ